MKRGIYMKLLDDDIKYISSIKDEPDWMLEFRLNSYKYFIDVACAEKICN